MNESDSTVALPAELAKQAERYLAQFDRGIITFDELENELIGAAHSLAGREFERSHPDWSKNVLFDRAAWETCFEAKRRAEAELGATFALALAEVYEQAAGLVAWVFRTPQWRQALKPVTARLIEAGNEGAGAMESEASLGWSASWHGVLPPEARQAVRDAALDSEASMIDLLEADREGDAARVAQIVAASGRLGCVSPALHVLRLRRQEGRPVAASEVAALLDPGGLAEQGEFGGLTHMAVELLADGATETAVAWSSAVDDAQLFHAPAERPTIYSGHAPYRAYHQDRLTRDHGPGWCVQWCNTGDARLLGALATVDWIGGDHDRARERATACDRGADQQGWSASGVELLAEWVLSRDLEPAERFEALNAMTERGVRAHVVFGLLSDQIDEELAELSALLDRPPEEAAQHRTNLDRIRAKPKMYLHFEPFQFPSLLERLPHVERLIASAVTVDANP